MNIQLNREVGGSNNVEARVIDYLPEGDSVAKITIEYDYKDEKRIIDPSQGEWAKAICGEGHLCACVKNHIQKIIQDDLDGLRSRVKED